MYADNAFLYVIVRLIIKQETCGLLEICLNDILICRICILIWPFSCTKVKNCRNVT